MSGDDGNRERIGAAVARIVATTGTGREELIPLLQAVQREFHYLPPEALAELAEQTGIPPAEIAGVSTFYTRFRHRPAGQHIIRVCTGTACHVKGSDQVLAAFRRTLRLRDGEDTDAEGRFTVEPVACLGCCTLAPAVVIGGATYGHMSPGLVEKTLADFLSRPQAAAETDPAPAAPAASGAEIRVGLGSCCQARGSDAVRAAVERLVRDCRIAAAVKRVGCVGMCHRTPLLEIVKPGEPPALYAGVTPRAAERAVRRHFPPERLLSRLARTADGALEYLLSDAAREPLKRYSLDTREQPVAEFLGRQKHVSLEHCGSLDPLDLDEYISRGGFAALRSALESKNPEAVIETVMRSGLRGRGGAGFPTARKWRLVRAAAGDEKYVIMNGDEGDPGAFMDRMLLESYPYRVLEGLTLAAFAVGAREGVLYIREEYPLAVRRVRAALEECAARGLTGENILGSGFSLRLRLREGAGAFVCGEETALIASLEGRRGTPRPRPPYPSERGLRGKPTLVNNVETLANVPWILRNGADAFAALGAGESRGTKVFALAGKIRRGGLIEVPMGATLRQIVEEIGGGVAEGRRFKAVQIGGPSGGCVPAELADALVEYETLAELEAIMGSGGLVVLDDADCMVDMARYFLAFTQEQSCGRCAPCRDGTRRMLDILNSLCAGTAGRDDLERLEELALAVKAGSLCGLGQTAPNPVLSTLRHFRNEYEAHLAGKCPAGKCQALIKYVVTAECIGCDLCAKACPAEAIAPRPYRRHEIDGGKCVKCDLCRQTCPVQAIRIE